MIRLFLCASTIAATMSIAHAQQAQPMTEADMRAAIVVLNDEKSAAETRAVSALKQLEAMTKERDELKAAAKKPTPEDDKK